MSLNLVIESAHDGTEIASFNLDTHYTDLATNLLHYDVAGLFPSVRETTDYQYSVALSEIRTLLQQLNALIILSGEKRVVTKREVDLTYDERTAIHDTTKTVIDGQPMVQFTEVVATTDQSTLHACLTHLSTFLSKGVENVPCILKNLLAPEPVASPTEEEPLSEDTTPLLQEVPPGEETPA
jgi:hypothetical protein